MNGRTVDISNQYHLSLKNKQLVLSEEKVQVASIPIEDLAVLILNHPAITFSLSLMVALIQHNVAVIFTDLRHMPIGIVQSLEGNTMLAKVLRGQLEVSLPRKKRQTC